MLGYVRQTGGHLIAEGVETEAELDTLRRLGVTLIQGYLLGRPAAPWPGVTIPAALVPASPDAPPSPAVSLHDAPA